MKQSTVVKLGSAFEPATLIGVDNAQSALQMLDHNLAASEVAALRNFNSAYLIITQKVRQALKKQVFADAEFLNRFDARFVHYYIHALEVYSAGGNIPESWQTAFDAASSRAHSPLISMALGINAHVNNDIPQVLRDTDAGPEHYQDYLLLNSIIRASIYEVIDDLDSHSHPLSPKHLLLKPWYKLFMGLLIKIWRHNAWKKHQKLRDGSLSVEQIEASAQRMAVIIRKLPL